MPKRDLVQEAAVNAKSLQLDEIHSKFLRLMTNVKEKILY